MAILYFASGFPLGIFYDLLPVYFRQQGIELRQIGLLSLLGLAWTLKFLWAPAIDHYRRHRKWMFIANLIMASVMLYLAVHHGFDASVWLVIGIFTLSSATNDIAIDGYTLEHLKKNEMGLANGVRIGFYRVGMLAAGVVLILSAFISWSGAYITAALIFGASGFICLGAPKEKIYAHTPSLTLLAELQELFLLPRAFATVLIFALGTLWLINSGAHWSATIPYFWTKSVITALLIFLASLIARAWLPPISASERKLTQGPLFGALMELLRRPHIIPVIIFILIFKLPDTAIGFMIKPFWVDSGFTAGEIGFISVNLGIAFSVAGGLAGGWITDKIGIFRSLWISGLLQALPNLVYALAASVVPKAAMGAPILFKYKLLIYSASVAESFAGGLGTAAFLAFLMAIINKKRAATEFALLSSVFALSRSLAGWASGFGAQNLGYASYFLLTFFLLLPAYLFLPWVKKMLHYAAARKDWDQT